MDPSSTASPLVIRSAAGGGGGNTEKVRRQPPPDKFPIAEPQEVEDDDEFWPLSGKPYFHVFLKTSHVEKGFNLTLPAKISQQLPTAMIPAKIIYRGKTWDLIYNGDRNLKRFENQGWRKFVRDNNLTVGDACLFELMEVSNTLKFKVQVFRCNFPFELLDKVQGFTRNNPIRIG